MAPQHVLNLKRGNNKVMPIPKPSLCGSFHPVKSGPYQGLIRATSYTLKRLGVSLTPLGDIVGGGRVQHK